MGIFWKRATGMGATIGMLAGMVVTTTYMANTQPWLRELLFGIARTEPVDLFMGVQPMAAGAFGAPVAFAVIFVVSLMTKRPDDATQELVNFLREPQ